MEPFFSYDQITINDLSHRPVEPENSDDLNNTSDQPDNNPSEDNNWNEYEGNNPIVPTQS